MQLRLGGGRIAAPASTGLPTAAPRRRLVEAATIAGTCENCLRADSISLPPFQPMRRDSCREQLRLRTACNVNTNAARCMKRAWWHRARKAIACHHIARGRARSQHVTTTLTHTHTHITLHIVLTPFNSRAPKLSDLSPLFGESKRPRGHCARKPTLSCARTFGVAPIASISTRRAQIWLAPRRLGQIIASVS